MDGSGLGTCQVADLVVRDIKIKLGTNVVLTIFNGHEVVRVWTHGGVFLRVGVCLLVCNDA